MCELRELIRALAKSLENILPSSRRFRSRNTWTCRPWPTRATLKVENSALTRFRQRKEACRPWGLVSSCFFHHLRVSVCSWHVLQWYGNDNVIHFDRPWTTPVWAHTAAGFQYDETNPAFMFNMNARTDGWGGRRRCTTQLCLSMTFVGTSKLATKEMNDASFAWAWRLF